MKIVIKGTNIKLNQGIKQYINEKFNGLEKFARVFQNKKKYFFKGGKPKVEMWVEVGRTTLHHRKGEIFRAEGQLKLPGKSLRAEAQSEDLKIAINEVKDELQRELKKYKERSITLTKRGARIFKKFLKLAGFKIRKGERTREEGRF